MKSSFRFGLVAALAACSGEPDQSLLLDPTTTSDQADSTQRDVSAADEDTFFARTVEEAEAEFQKSFASPLSEEELSIVENALVARGVDVTRTKIVGRVIVRDDTYESADDLLDAARVVVEKGVVAGEPSEYDYARMINPLTGMPADSGIFETRRPYFGRYNNIKIIVPNNTVRNIMQQAADAVENAADDCITSSIFSVMLQSDWDALGIGQADYPAIGVVYGAANVACPSSPNARGCAYLPRFYSMRLPNGTYQHRIGVGFRIGLDSTFVTDSLAGVSTATHELLHTLGLAHTYVDEEEDRTPITVPGTRGIGAQFSIMRQYGNPYRSDAMGPDDILTLDVLYSPSPGGSCAFTDVFEATCVAGCTKISTNLNLTGHCCWCNSSTPKQYVKAPWSTQTYLCQ